jgi:hypothetical protein
MGEAPGVCPGLDKVIVTPRVVDGLTEGPSRSPGLDKVIVTPRVVARLNGEWLTWAIDMALLCHASTCWKEVATPPQNQPSAGASVCLSPECIGPILRKDNGDSKCARLQRMLAPAVHLSVMGSLEQVPAQSPEISTQVVGCTVQSPREGSQQTTEGCGAGVIIGNMVAGAAIDEVG